MIIYSHLNKTNGKRYVGWTKLSLMRRWHVHVLRASNGSSNVFHKAIRKYPEDVWEHTVLDVVSTLKGALIAEKCWISHFKCNAFSGYGYNMTDGGQGSLGRKHSNETKQKISQARINSGVAKGSKNPMYGKAFFGEENGFWGKSHTSDTKSKISEKKKGVSNPKIACSQQIIDKIVILHTAGYTLNQICVALSSECIKPPRANTWHKNTIHRILKRVL